MWALKMNTLDNARNAREIDVNEKFQLWKSQIDADHSLYRSQIEADFGLYKNTRDSFDALSARIGALETKQAVAEAVEPWRAKVLDMRINEVANNSGAAIALEAERRCCADNKLVNYMNSTFYPVSVADVTTGTTVTPRTLTNPLCGFCDPCYRQF